MSSYLFPKILPTPHTEKAWFPSSYDMQNFSSLDALEQEEENYAKKLFQIAKTPAPEPIGSKFKNNLSRSHRAPKASKSEEEEEEEEESDDEMSGSNRSEDERFLHMRRRRRHRIGATATTRHRARRFPQEETQQQSEEEGEEDDDSSTVVATRDELYMRTTQSSLDVDDMDVESDRDSSS